MGQLHGKVCDGSGNPIASATVTLTAGAPAKSFASQTGADGNFSLPSLPLGNYTLQVAAAGFTSTSFSSISIGPESKTFDVSLQPANANGSSASPQFFDPPQFTVSGVTDTTNIGGHGSGPITRNRESVEKDVTSLGSPSPTPPGGAGSNPYDLALADVNAGRYAQARDQLQSLLAHQPTPQAHHLLATVDERLGNSLAAVQQYQQAAELDPTESNIFDWGSELLLHHAAEPAIEVFTKGNRLFPDSTRMLIGWGAAEFAAGSYDRAIQRLCQASDLHPDDPVPYLFLGKMQRTENAVPVELMDRFHRFAKLDPDNAEANYLYAAALWKQNQPTPADAIIAQVQSLLKAALRRYPQLGEAQLQLGLVHTYQHDLKAAIADFQHAIQDEPGLEEAHYRLAQAYRTAGRTEDAKAEIAAYERIHRQSTEQTEQEHRQIKQFVYSLRDKATAQSR